DLKTRVQDVFVLCHLGVPRLDRDQWSITINGMVEYPRTLRIDDMLRYPKTEVVSVHQCCGSPLEPPRMIEKYPPGRSERCPPGLAVQQLYADLQFEIANVSA